jgi:RHS repeat-associated protein
MTDSSGAMQAQYAFDPYGREIKIQGPLAPDFRFAGYYVHEPSGLNYTLTRSYSPPIGRWTARDPIEEDGGINLYAYVENNPISNVDPSGLASPWADKKDAIKHCIWSCMLRKVSRRFAKSLGDLFEAETAQTRQSHEVDLANNEVGRQAPRRVNCCDWCHQKYREGKLFGPTWDPSGKPLVGPLSPIPENSQFGSGPNTTWWQGPRN